MQNREPLIPLTIKKELKKSLNGIKKNQLDALRKYISALPADLKIKNTSTSVAIKAHFQRAKEILANLNDINDATKFEHLLQLIENVSSLQSEVMTLTAENIYLSPEVTTPIIAFSTNTFLHLAHLNHLEAISHNETEATTKGTLLYTPAEVLVGNIAKPGHVDKKDLAALSETSTALHGLFSPVLRKEKIKQLLNYVVRFDMDNIKTMLEKDPTLLFEKSSVIDMAGRSFIKPISALEYTLWAEDAEMCQAMLAILDRHFPGSQEINDKLRHQYHELTNEGGGLTYTLKGEKHEHETHFDIETIPTAIHNLCDYCDPANTTWNEDDFTRKRDEFINCFSCAPLVIKSFKNFQGINFREDKNYMELIEKETKKSQVFKRWLSTRQRTFDSKTDLIESLPLQSKGHNEEFDLLTERLKPSAQAAADKRRPSS